MAQAASIGLLQVCNISPPPEKEKTMKTLAILLAGIALGSFATFVVQGYAEQSSSPGVFLVSEIDIGDQDGYAKYYSPRAVEISKKHGAHYLAAGGAASSPISASNKITTFDDESRANLPPTRRMVVAAYPDLDHVKAYRADPEYQEVRQKAISSGWVKLFRSYAIDAVASTAN
jgi:uncharacterized protein (DUF1330 family)